MQIKCADCGCFPSECKLVKSPKNCPNCSWEQCCCLDIHQNQQPIIWLKKFGGNIKRLYFQALGIEILCIAFAELGQNSSFSLFGYGEVGIISGYVLGYALAGFATFVTILGRYDRNTQSDACCAVLKYESDGLVITLKMTLQNFANGIKKITKLGNQPDWKKIVKSSIYVLITAESVCILIAMTVDLIFYRYSMLLSIPLSLAAGALAIVIPVAYRRSKGMN